MSIKRERNRKLWFKRRQLNIKKSEHRRRNDLITTPNSVDMTLAKLKQGMGIA